MTSAIPLIAFNGQPALALRFMILDQANKENPF